MTNGSYVTKFVYQGLSGHVIKELNSSNAVIRSYAWDAAGRQLYVKIGSSFYYQITNLHGDNVAWASASGLVGTEHFDPWGNLTYTPAVGATTTPFGFQGGLGSWTDATTSFVSMGVRWYYPKVSEFLSSDPAAGTANPRTPIDRMRWLYGADDPLIKSDPTGLYVPTFDPYSAAPAAVDYLPAVTFCNSACEQSRAVAAAIASDANRENHEHAIAQGSAHAASAAAAASAEVAARPGSFTTHPACDWWCTAEAMGANFISHAAGSGNMTLTNMASSTIDQIDQFITDPARVVGDVSHGNWADLPAALSTYLTDSMQEPSNLGAGALQLLSGLDPVEGTISLAQALQSSPDPVTAAGRAGDWYGERLAKGSVLGVAVGTALMGVDVPAPEVATSQTALGSAADARTLADAVREWPADSRPSVVSVLRTQDGDAIGGGAGGPYPLHPIIRGLLERFPGVFDGGCAELQCLSQALDRDLDLSGAEIGTAQVRGPASASGLHGQPIEPCAGACSPILRELGVTWDPGLWWLWL